MQEWKPGDIIGDFEILELLGGSGMGQTILVVPRASDIPPQLINLERRSIESGVMGEAAA